MSGLRLEKAKPSMPPAPAPVADIAPVASLGPAPEAQDLVYWRALAVSTGERLKYAENNLKDLRASTDEIRDRLMKAKRRQEAGQARSNELQSALVAISAERDGLREQVRVLCAEAAEREQFKERLWNLWAEM